MASSKFNICMDCWYGVILPDLISCPETPPHVLPKMTPCRLLAIRTKLSLSQDELSRLLHIGGKTWSRWECGVYEPSPVMRLLIHALDSGHIKLAWLKALERV